MESGQSLPVIQLPFAAEVGGRHASRLQLAAAANILLTEFKIADRIKDGGLVRLRFVQRFFSGGFRRAAALLPRLNFRSMNCAAYRIVRMCANLIRFHRGAIRRRRCGDLPLRPPRPRPYFSLTARARSGDRKTSVVAPEVVDAMRRLGYDFGRLVYLLDAFEDYEKDWRQGEFNALRAALGWTTESLTVEQRRQAAERLLDLRRRIVNRISSLPITVDYAKLFSERLDYNLFRKIGKSLPVLNCEAPACRKRDLTLPARWKNAVSFAKRMMNQDGLARSKIASLKEYLAFAPALAAVFLLPSAASRIKVWQDCRGLRLQPDVSERFTRRGASDCDVNPGPEAEEEARVRMS